MVDDKNGGQEIDDSPKFIVVEENAPKANDHDDGKSIGLDKQPIFEEANNKQQQQQLTERSPKEEPNSPAEVMYTQYDDCATPTPSNKLLMQTQADQDEDMIF